MAAPNEFARQTLRAVGYLFERHPKAETLTFNNLLYPPMSEGRVDNERLEYAIGTLRWLLRANIIDGDDGLDKGYIAKAQLSLKAYARLLEKVSQFNDPSLGAAISRVSRDPGSREIDELASLLLQRMTI